MKTTISIIIFLFFTLPGTWAQIQDLLTNPHITWVAETELEYDFAPEYLIGQGIPESDHRYEYRVRKYDFDECDYVFSIVYALADALEEGNLLAYDRAGGRQLTLEEIQQKFSLGMDTVTTFDPETFEERIKVVTICEPAYLRVRSLLVKQVWYYHQKTKQLANRVVGASLLMPVYDKKKDAVLKEKKVLMYVAFPADKQKSVHANLPNVPFCMETTEYQETRDFKTLKGNLSETFEELFFQLPKKKAIDIYSREAAFCCNQLLAQEEFEYLFYASTDSIVMFDPHDYSETLKVIKNPELRFEMYSTAYKFMQTWYFDIKTNQLVSNIDAVAPAKDALDDNGNFLYTQPLFYLCFRKNGK